jgi:hypothetical protein
MWQSISTRRQYVKLPFLSREAGFSGSSGLFGLFSLFGFSGLFGWTKSTC